MDFHAEWWGNTQAFEIGSIITMRQEAIWTGLVPLACSYGKIFVRREYSDMYDWMVNAAKEYGGYPPGGIITGQPGIGKSPISHFRPGVSYV